MSNNLLKVENLGFSYSQKSILNDVSFTLNQGEILGLLGPNGVGKTTIIKLLTGFFKLQQGSVFFKDCEIGWAGSCISADFRATLGVVFQECSLDSKISANENLKLSGQIYGLNGVELDKLVNESLNLFGLNEQDKIKTKKLSGGMKRRLELARAMLHKPQILLLDEPTVGLDENWRRLFFSQLQGLSSAGLSTLISTHRLDEAEYCHRLLVMHKGKVLLSCTPDELKSKVSDDRLSLSINSSISSVDIANKVISLNNHFSPLKFMKNSQEIKVVLSDAHAIVPRVVDFLPDDFIESLNVSKPTLSDAYLKVTGAQLGEV